MSNDIYKILNNFNKLTEQKPEPTKSPEAKPKTKLQENIEQIDSKYTQYRQTLMEMDKSQPSSDRGGESSGNPYAKGGKATPVKAKDMAKHAEKTLNKAVKKSRGVKEAQQDESALQAYLGKKKYGEEGMKALQQAGRDGASKEKMASIRAKHDKMDEDQGTAVPWQVVINALASGYPDLDPIDSLAPIMRKYGVEFDDLNLLAQQNGYNDIYAVLDEFGQDQDVAEAAKWRDPSREGQTWERDDASSPNDPRPGKIPLRRTGRRNVNAWMDRGTGTTSDPLAWKAAQKKAAGRLTPADVKHGVQKNFPQIDEQGVAEGGNIGGGQSDDEARLRGMSVKQLDSLIKKLEGKPASHAPTHKFLKLAKKIRAEKIGKKNVSEQQVNEKAVSRAQQKFMGMVHSAKKGGKPASPAVAKAAKGMSKKAARDFAATKHKGLPQHVNETIIRALQEGYSKEQIVQYLLKESDKEYWKDLIKDIPDKGEVTKTTHKGHYGTEYQGDDDEDDDGDKKKIAKPTGEKRGRGRPKGVKNRVVRAGQKKAAASGEKRGRGRPPGSKNKMKEAWEIEHNEMISEAYIKLVEKELGQRYHPERMPNIPPPVPTDPTYIKDPKTGEYKPDVPKPAPAVKPAPAKGTEKRSDIEGDTAVAEMMRLAGMESKLHGKQHKLDVDKDGDIEADDLKDLRAGMREEGVAGEEGVTSMITQASDDFVKQWKNDNEPEVALGAKGSGWGDTPVQAAPDYGNNGIITAPKYDTQAAQKVTSAAELSAAQARDAAAQNRLQAQAAPKYDPAATQKVVSAAELSAARARDVAAQARQQSQEIQKKFPQAFKYPNKTPKAPFPMKDMEEGNEFSGALDAARDAGKKEFEVDGKTYPVRESQLDECGEMGPMANGMGMEQEGKMNVSTNMSSDGNKSVTVTADGEAAVELMQLLALAGMKQQGQAEVYMETAFTPAADSTRDPNKEQQRLNNKLKDVAGSAKKGAEQKRKELKGVKEEKDSRYEANTTPEEDVIPLEVQLKGGDGDVAGKEKEMNPNGSARFSDNPLAVKVKESMTSKLMREYEGIKVKR